MSLSIYLLKCPVLPRVCGLFNWRYYLLPASMGFIGILVSVMMSLWVMIQMNRLCCFCWKTGFSLSVVYPIQSSHWLGISMNSNQNQQDVKKQILTCKQLWCNLSIDSPNPLFCCFLVEELISMSSISGVFLYIAYHYDIIYQSKFCQYWY